MILGDFGFGGTYSTCVLCNIIVPVLAILNVHRVLGPIFFLTYVFFVFFVLLNMFLAIINDTYAEVKNDMGNQQSEFELGEYFKRSYGRMLERLNFKRDVSVSIDPNVNLHVFFSFLSVLMIYKVH